MNLRTTASVICVAAIGLSGCSSTVFKTHQFETTPPTSLSVDAKQRVLLSKKRPGTNKLVVCFEPSPDALVAAASSLGGSLGVPEQVAAELSGALSEQVSNIGLRTHTVTLLREGLYRACEAYANGAIEKEQYRQILNGYGALVLTMMAIEQVSGVHQVPQIVLGPGKADANTSTSEGAADQPGSSTATSASAGGGGSNYTLNYTVNPPSRESAIVVRQLAGSYLLFQVGEAAAAQDLLTSDDIKEAFGSAVDSLLGGDTKTSP